MAWAFSRVLSPSGAQSPRSSRASSSWAGNGIHCDTRAKTHPPYRRDSLVSQEACIHLNIATCKWCPFILVLKKPCFKWLQNVPFKEPCRSGWINPIPQPCPPACTHTAKRRPPSRESPRPRLRRASCARSHPPGHPPVITGSAPKRTSAFFGVAFLVNPKNLGNSKEDPCFCSAPAEIPSSLAGSGNHSASPTSQTLRR